MVADGIEPRLVLAERQQSNICATDAARTPEAIPRVYLENSFGGVRADAYNHVHL